ncbi:complement receptor type 2-like isoform X2 [Mauremys reevesii]|uniref:complement receptor type 2-like isoform X2 n=1 Tax=Mauremys reevesii TaxID=260615 RepID=UPI00193FC857|nr:complement receptor type 2-like isoform X2 [Mauremys reevesii]
MRRALLLLRLLGGFAALLAAAAQDAVGCGVPTRLSFAELRNEYKNQNDFSVGKTAKYMCRPGYRRDPQLQPTIKCLENGRWSEALEFCKKKSCGHPGEPENGRVIITDIQFGSTVHFACEEGHRLIGKPYRRCEIYETRVAWSGEVPICERIPCLPPPDIPNGRHTGVIMDGFSYGSVVTYKCESSYPLTGEATIHCTTKDGLNGEWSARPPRCGEVRCPAPQIQNGRRVSGDRNVYSYKDSVTFECDPGYTMKGHSLSQCQTDDTWDPPLPVCELVTCISPEVENGRTNGVQPAYRPRDLVVFECDPGFTLSGSPETRCQDDGRWDPPVPVCERMLQCPSPPAIANGKPSIQASAVFTTGTSVNYSCEPGYSLTGQASIYCTASATWSPPPPQCEEVLCITPEIQNGRKVAGHGPVYRPRDTVRFECDPGYTLNGSRHIQCRDDRTWDPPVPACIQALPCPPPPVIVNGKHSAKPLTAFPSGTYVNYSCEPDYALRGEASIYCTTSGTWSHPSPLCEEGCGVPTRLSFAELKSEYKNQSSFPVGKTINYTCRPGYSRHPRMQSTLTCLENRTWSEAFEFCKKKSCGHPGEPENGRVIVTDILVGSTVNFTCEEGHRLIGQPYRRCEIYGTRVAWSGEVPICERIPCLPPPDIPNGRRTLMKNFFYGSAVTYKCNSGYPLTGEASIHCTTEDGQNGVWNARPPRCGEVRCPVPQIQNGRRVSGDRQVYSYKDSVTFECDPGYTMKGHRLSECQTDDTWDPPLPVCEPATCISPEVENGRTNGVQPTYRPRDIVVFECDPGYTLSGSPETQCQDDGRWDPPVPVCERMLQCPAPPAIANGKPSSRDLAVFTSGTSVNYSCEPGYSLTGQASIYCTASGTWSPPPPRCEEVLCIAPEIQHGRKVAGRGPVYRPRDTVRFECDPGYTLNGSRHIQCRDEGTWDPPVPACIREVRCPVPQIQNGRRVSGDRHVYSYKDSVTFECNPGYTMKGHSLSQCQADDTWDPPLPVCEPATCMSPEVENGRTNGVQPAYRPRDIVVFECNPGYTLSGSPETQCQDDGRWDPPVPVCERMLRCPSPPAITNGKPSGQDLAVFTSGTSVNYSCEPGYSLTGQASVYCTASGTWSPPPPRCEEVLCIAPEIQHGRKVAGRGPVYRPKDMVRFECDPGYTLNGSRHIQCQDEGTWDPPVPVCIQAMCISPEVENGRTNGVQPPYRPRDIVVFECNPGYTLSGSPETQCQDDGRWDPPVPVCERMLQCPSPPAIANGKPSSQDLAVFITGTSVNYSCEPGYSLTGQASIYCTASGTWSPPPPRCEEVLCIAPEIQNGRKVARHGHVYRPRDTVRFECDPGYTLNGSRQIQCRDEGTWDPPVPACIRALLCPPPPVIVNGKHSAKPLTAFPSGTYVNYSCEPGYALHGEASIYCTTSGTWSHPSPLCEDGCGVPTRLSFAELKSEYKNQSYFPVGKTINYTCRPGYSRQPQMPPTIKCLQNRMWSEALKFCKKKSCGHPGEPENGRVIITDILFGSTVNFTCEEGHRLIGQPYRRCEIYGTRVAWTDEVPICEKVRCPAPQIRNGRRVSGDRRVYLYKDSVTFECDPGYTMKGHSLSQCQTDDMWDPPLPVCEPVTCVSPEVENGRTNGVQPAYRPRDLVVFECDPGYTLSGSPETQCQDDGRWDPPVPVCERMLRCPSPPAITNGKPSSRDLAVFTTGTSVNYSCEPGYSLTGQASIYCTASGTWSPPPPQCEEVLCITPEIQHGRKVAEHGPVYRPRDTVRFKCDPGYTLNGSRQIQCRDDRTWDLPVPACIQELPCPAPPVIVKGKHNAKPLAAFPSGTYVNYSCEPGYVLRGEASIYCTTSGTWSHSSPLCEGSYNFISVVLGIAGGVLLLLLVTIIMWIMTKQNAGYYYTHENKYQIPSTHITEQKISFAP